MRLLVKVPRVYLFHHQSDPGANIVKIREILGLNENSQYSYEEKRLPEPRRAPADHYRIGPRMAAAEVERFEVGESLDLEIAVGDEA